MKRAHVINVKRAHVIIIAITLASVAYAAAFKLRTAHAAGVDCPVRDGGVTIGAPRGLRLPRSRWARRTPVAAEHQAAARKKSFESAEN